MKKSLTLKLIGGGLLLCIVNLLSLTSCENFLNGESVKEEIVDTIAYNNAKDISISLSCKEEMGIILPENIIERAVEECTQVYCYIQSYFLLL